MQRGPQAGAGHGHTAGAGHAAGHGRGQGAAQGVGQGAGQAGAQGAAHGAGQHGRGAQHFGGQQGLQQEPRNQQQPSRNNNSEPIAIVPSTAFVSFVVFIVLWGLCNK